MTKAQKLAAKRVWQRARYRKDPAVRDHIKRKTKANRDPVKMAEYRAEWVKTHPGATAAYNRKHRALRKAEGYDHLIQNGDTVNASYIGGDWRVLRRYVVDGEAVCDLDDGTRTMEECPMRSLKLKT